MDSEDDAQRDVADLVSAYHGLRSAEAARQGRVRSTTGLGENELRVLQFLLREGDVGHAVMPSEISRHLGVSSASTTALLDRLERAGLLERVGHPTDRRSILIAPTPAAFSTIAATVEEHEDMLNDAASRLAPAERRIVLDFLRSLTDGADASGATASAPSAR